MRADTLSHKGWSAFLPILDVGTIFGLSDDIVDELLRFEIEHCRSELGKFAYEPRYLFDLKRKAREAYAKSGEVIDLEFPSYRRELAILRRTDEGRYEQLRNAVKSMIEDEKRKEVKKHCRNYSAKYSNRDIGDRLRLYGEVMRGALGELGFSRDPSLSTRSNPIFTKELIADWRIGFVIDRENLNRPPLSEDDSSGSIDLYFGLVHASNRGMQFKDKKKFIVFSLEDLFPISRDPVAPVYSEFNDLKELEVMLLAHADMYSIIQEEFEGLLLEGVKQAMRSGLA